MLAHGINCSDFELDIQIQILQQRFRFSYQVSLACGLVRSMEAAKGKVSAPRLVTV